jgi:hypothetical protein
MASNLLFELFRKLLTFAVNRLTFGLTRHLSLLINSSEVTEMNKLVLEVVILDSASGQLPIRERSLGMRVWDAISLRASTAAISARVFGLASKARYAVKVISGIDDFEARMDSVSEDGFDTSFLHRGPAFQGYRMPLYTKRPSGTWEVNPVLTRLLVTTINA